VNVIIVHVRGIERGAPFIFIRLKMLMSMQDDVDGVMLRRARQLFSYVLYVYMMTGYYR
jgi:hypothetical protein